MSAVSSLQTFYLCKCKSPEVTDRGFTVLCLGPLSRVSSREVYFGALGCSVQSHQISRICKAEDLEIRGANFELRLCSLQKGFGSPQGGPRSSSKQDSLGVP